MESPVFLSCLRLALCLLHILHSLFLARIHFLPFVIRQSTRSSWVFIVPKDTATGDTDLAVSSLWLWLFLSLIAILSCPVSIPLDTLDL